MDLDPVIIIKALNVAVLVVISGALFGFWRASGRQPFLLHWSLYELALAATVVVDGHMLLASLGVGIAVPLLLLGVIGYRQQKEPPPWVFLLLLAAIAIPAYSLAELFSQTHGLTYLVVSISIAYLAAAGLFLREGGPLNYFVAFAFLGRTVSVLLYPLWEAWDMLYLSYGVGQIFTLCAGVGMLMAGFAKAYGQLQKREQELIHAYNQSEELMLRLERRNEEYLQARQNAEAANGAKTQFLANMSHELRTPLNAILGFSEVLMVMPVEQVTQKVSGYARNIHDAASGLQSIISDILNLSRVEAGALELQQEACDLTEVLAEICRLLQPLANQKDITLEHRDGVPCIAWCDRRLTRQALINGLSNAIKYTQRGGTVICHAELAEGQAVAMVEDNGVGIDEMLLKKVFEPFWQEGNSFVAENTGVGLGLSIAKSYVEAQGGQIELKPAGQRGTVFVIRLPLPEAASRDGHAAA